MSSRIAVAGAASVRVVFAKRPVTSKVGFAVTSLEPPNVRSVSVAACHERLQSGCEFRGSTVAFGLKV
jgi:hypothetical protein